MGPPTSSHRENAQFMQMGLHSGSKKEPHLPKRAGKGSYGITCCFGQGEHLPGASPTEATGLSSVPALERVFPITGLLIPTASAPGLGLERPAPALL